MKHIKNFEEMNESWRQVKAYFRLPQILIELLLKKLIKFVPRLNFEYDQMSAKLDVGKSLSYNIIKEEPIKLTLDDIKNDNIRKTLKMTGIFNNWNIYTFDRKSHEGRTPVYITKDELKLGDKCYGDRLSDSDVDSNYGKNTKKYLKSKGVKDINELEPQFYVIAAVHTSEHDDMRKERDVRYKRKINKGLEKLVDDCIKNDNCLNRSKSIYGHWDNFPILFKVIKEDRVDLAKKIIDSITNDEDKERLLKMSVDSEGWEKQTGYAGKTPLMFAKSDEMKSLLNSYIKYYDDMEKYNL